MHTSLTDLPNEILFQILLHVPPHLTPPVLLISRRFNHVAERRLWKYHCHTQYRYWSQDYGFNKALLDNPDPVEWKKVFSDRYIIDRQISHYLDSIVASQSGKIENAEKIVAFGYDAKDTLLRHMNAPDDADDVLARRFHSAAVLGCLHRTIAVQEWVQLNDGGSASLERALAAFDMFVLNDGEGDFDCITARLNSLAFSLLDEIPEFRDFSPRQKARTVASYLRKRHLIGIKYDGNYYDIQNNFMGIALQDKDHPSLPLISVAIYCCVAQRLGVRAYPCGFPFHVLAVIKPVEDLDMDGRMTHSPEDVKPIYMDPFQSDHEVPISDLQHQLAAMGVSSTDYGALLDSSSIAEIIRRTARNIINAIQKGSHIHTNRASFRSSLVDSDSAFYGALLALLLLPESTSTRIGMQRALPYIVEHLKNQFYMDVSLVEQYVLPIFKNLRPIVALHHSTRLIRATDSEPKASKRRSQATRTKVKYRVGQVFGHVRYAYQAVIIGWDIECGATEEWMSQMSVDNLAYGRHQSFYHVLVDDSSTRYVAEENIMLQNPDEPNQELMRLAGRFFKRWDYSTREFVSNIKDEYPDD